MAGGSVREREQSATWELNLAPMLDMLVSLMTILLMAFTTVRIGILETALPQPVAQAMEKDRNKKEREIEFVLDLNARQDITFKIKNKDGSVKTVTISAKDGKFDLDRLHQEAVQWKLKHPGVFRIEVNPTDELEYKDIVRVMDKVRQTVPSDPKVTIKDEATGQESTTNLLFPDVVFANVVEG